MMAEMECRSGAGVLPKKMTQREIVTERIVGTVNRVPEHMQAAALRYMLHGLKPGQFLTALLYNDLLETFARADNTNHDAVHDWLKWLYNCCPGNSYGSAERVAEWIAHEGLDGVEFSDEPSRKAPDSL